MHNVVSPSDVFPYKIEHVGGAKYLKAGDSQSSKYHNFQYFQDKKPNLNFLRLNQDRALQSWGFQSGRFSGSYDIMLNLA